MNYYLITFILAFCGGFTQAIAGFGAAIIMMIGFPYFLPLVQASGCSSAICIGSQLMNLITYRKYFDLKKLCRVAFVPIVIYLSVSIFIINRVTGFNMKLLKAGFGIFLILLALYYIFLSKKAEIKPSPLSGAICGAFSRFCGGAFGVGGPPMALYLLGAAGGNKYDYLVFTQAVFLVSSVSNALARVANGILTVDLIPYIAAGLIGAAFGTKTASFFVGKINASLYRYIVYALVAVSGIITLIQSI